MAQSESESPEPKSFNPSHEAPSPDELVQWQRARTRIGDLVLQQQQAGRCAQCINQATQGAILGAEHLLYEDQSCFATLCADPRSPGHTIVVWREHVPDFMGLDPEQTAHIFTVASRVGRALRTALQDVEQVYLVSMCDGPLNHLHLQLIPRYQHTPMGSGRLVDPRGPLREAAQIQQAVRMALSIDEAGEFEDPTQLR